VSRTRQVDNPDALAELLAERVAIARRSHLTIDGGYAEVMIAEARGTVAIPDELSSVDAAPLLCAGVTTFNALRNAGIRAGGLVAIQGIGGLGHLGTQFARRMGFHTVAIGLGADGGLLAKGLGAHLYIDSEVENPGSRLCNSWAERRPS
jgi:alcohol dehydrogenase, propanol-preferring